ncbi:aminopeptidase N [Neodiprion lecontei]|uniref:Aminopeptidase n=1 Tax=Neodiprion lecontei TaxID=441921 RepID=A0A6J0BZX3_NEOLC|nr:aminopeptidase N [Neodiprion lecontei]XP_015519765.2 aminopeptidase N [Neodiprion lecontei]XP_015519766.2 aminopeptidase N [Neodiprion lecontei]XP_046586585.1 aminopeptidase N [Neodiprion lecontei]XP_046586586.1 aminopeptidase N [Neodiprion lecontei]
MTQSREVLAMMDAHTTTFGRKRGCTISRCGAFLLGTLFLLSLVITALLVYHFAPCADGALGRQHDASDSGLFAGRGFLGANSVSTKLDVRLPRSVVPVFYRLELTPFIWEGNFTFNGEVKIVVNVTEDTRNITLHAVDMKIDEAATTVQMHPPDNNGTIRNRMEDVGIDKQTNDTLRQFHVIHTAGMLKAGKQYTVYIKYVGYLNDYLQGFYRSSYTVGNQTRWIATTQFQPTDARRAFPCFDEPALKAEFEIHIARPKNMTSISNMNGTVDTTPIVGLPSYEWDRYERSVPMSTYLVAFVVSDFATQRSDDGKVGVWVRSEALDQADYSLKIAPQILKYFENYFAIDFPLPKMDMVALPDFSAGAMENWGLITYRETAMLYQEGVSTNSNKQRVATVVAHELAHQWFGNLVTPSWWTDLWLNEGFASYVEYIGMNAVEPSWKVLEQFVVHELQNVFALDALASSHPISVEVGHPDEISEIFDRISYGKGASIIRMMDHFITTNVFKRGLSNYLRERAYQSAEQNDLWDALTKQAHKDGVLDKSITINEIMDTWTLQTGFPVVTVNRDYNRGSATLTQERFLLQTSTTEVSDDKPLWWIPITYTSQNVLNFNETIPSRWMQAEPTITLSNLNTAANEWVIFNVQETGYYRVNYDEQNWRLIIQELNKASFKSISTINRAQLLDDALNLARAGRLDYATALDVTSYLAHETEYLPWKAAFTAMGYLDRMLVKTEGYDRFRIFALKLLDNIYKQTGFKDIHGDPQLTVFTRIDVLSWACSLGHKDCVQNAVTQFHNWQITPNPDNNNPISPNLKSVVYCTAIRVGGQAEWDFAWERYQKTNVGSEKDLLLHALGCTRETWILSRYLNWAVTENSGIRKQDAGRVFGSVANNVIGQPLAFNYLRNQWKRIKTYFGTSLLTINNIIKSTTKKMNTAYELKALYEFETEHSAELAIARRAVQQTIEQTEANIKWLDRNHETILNWLKRATA